MTDCIQNYVVLTSLLRDTRLQTEKMRKDVEGLLTSMANAAASMATCDSMADRLTKLLFQVTQAAEREAKLVSRLEIVEQALTNQNSKIAALTQAAGGSNGPAGPPGVDKVTVIAIAQEVVFHDNLKGASSNFVQSVCSGRLKSVCVVADIESKVQETREVLAGATKDIVDLQTKVAKTAASASAGVCATCATVVLACSLVLFLVHSRCIQRSYVDC